ncbi:MAG: hypothetical protein AAF483_01490 [Planctomycetota bacterium]
MVRRRELAKQSNQIVAQKCPEYSFLADVFFRTHVCLDTNELAEISPVARVVMKTMA